MLPSPIVSNALRIVQALQAWYSIFDLYVGSFSFKETQATR